jgi:translation initiation factor 1
MADDKPFHTPFSGLGDLTGVKPAPAPAATSPPAPVPSDPGARRIPRAVVRLERAGRGGKDVTVIEHLDLRPAERQEWLRALKSALGCGGQLEESTIVLQGDQRPRLPKWLEARGVKKVTVS